jgi:hypothetical protein
MSDFFKVFDQWCIQNGYGKQPHQKYGNLWTQFGIKVGRGRILFGVGFGETVAQNWLSLNGTATIVNGTKKQA